MPNRWRAEPKVTYKMERTRSRSSSGGGGGSSSGGGGDASASNRGAGGTSTNSSEKGGAESTGRSKARASSIGSSSSEDFTSPSPAKSNKKMSANKTSDKGVVSRKSIGSGVQARTQQANDESMGQKQPAGGSSLESAFMSASESGEAADSASGNGSVGASSSDPNAARSASAKRKRGGTPSRIKSSKSTTESGTNDDGDDKAGVQSSAKRVKKSRKSLSCEDTSIPSSSDEEGDGEGKNNNNDRDPSSDKKNPAGSNNKVGNEGGGANAGVVEIMDDDSSTLGSNDSDDEVKPIPPNDKQHPGASLTSAAGSHSSTKNPAENVASSAAQQQQQVAAQAVQMAGVAAAAPAAASSTTSATHQARYSQTAIKNRTYDDGSVAPAVPPKRGDNGLFQRPSGRSRKGMDWDGVHGVWRPAPPGGGGSVGGGGGGVSDNGSAAVAPVSAANINCTEQKPESQSSSQSVTAYDTKEKPLDPASTRTFGGMEVDNEEEEKKDDAPGAETSPTTPTRKTSTPPEQSAPSSSPGIDGSPMEFPMDLNEDGHEEDRPIDPEAVVCWACNIPLQRKDVKIEPSSDAEDNDDNGWGDKVKTLGLYSIHAHPLLQISVCSSCADKAYDIEDEALQCEAARAHKGDDDGGEEDGDADVAEMEACSLCAVEATNEGDGPILLCCDACPRTFCARCVTVMNGGGVNGRKYVEEQMNGEEDESEWNCPACEAPDAMDRMQVAFVRWSDEGSTVEADRQPTGGDKGGSDGDPSSPDTKTTAALIDELNYAEDGLSEAAKKLEYDSIAQERESVLSEVRKDRSDLLAEGDIEKEVDAEMDGWFSQWQDHHSRLSEAITTLQDALEVRGIDLAAFYKDREANYQSDDNNDNVDGIPSYVKEAEAALDKRDEEQGFSKGEFRGSSGYKMDKNIANLEVEDLAQSDINDIEDINTLEGTLAQLEHISIRNTSGDRPCLWSKADLTEEDIENMRRRALRRDDEDLARLAIDVEKLERAGIKEDIDAAKEKDKLRKETTRRTAGGVRINLLALSTVKTKQKTERQSAKKARRKEREGASGPRYGEAFSGVRRNLDLGRDIVQPVRERLASDVSRREATAAAQGGKPSKRRIAPQIVASGPSFSTNRNLFSATSAFASLTTIDRYGDMPTKCQAPTFPFEESNLSLPCGRKDDGSEMSVSVAKSLATILKTHQVEGVKFMWENTCSDILSAGAGDNSETASGQIKGAILAHNMGLGKSVQLCAYLHTFLAHPSLVNAKKRQSSSSTTGGATSWHGTSTDPSSPTNILRSLQSSAKRRALLCVPVNTIANWVNEWSKWILTKEKGKQVPEVPMYNLNDYHITKRFAVLVEWMKEGGVLLTSDRILAGLCKPLIQPPDDKSSKKKKAISAAGEIGTDNDTDTGAITEAGTRSNSMTEMDKEFIKAALFQPGPDVVCLDEGHQMLKNSSTNISKVLHEMKGCPRRIVLTGTPIQNNLNEAYRMAKWTRPSCPLGTFADFQRNFTEPIMAGMKKDATAQELFRHDNCMQQLWVILDSFLQRRGADVLAKELPPMQQCVINIRQSKLQQKLYRQFGRYKKQADVKNNFFDQYQKLRPVNNHPATLLLSGRGDKKSGRSISPTLDSLESSRAPTPSLQTSAEGSITKDKNKDLTPMKSNSSSKVSAEGDIAAPEKKVDDGIIEIDDGLTDDDAPVGAAATLASSKQVAAGESLNRKSSDLEKEKWWKPVHNKTGDGDFKDVREGGKIVLLLQILAHADLIGDKVVCFTQCLKTIDFIESILNSDWGQTIPAIETLGAAEGRTWGQWRRNREYLRIDGATSASDRGDLVTSFNQAHDSSSSKALENQAKLFLISKEAGGVGINLYAANRVILFDSHWNPAVDLQAIYRCYRYGQTKSVFAYRFLTEGTMEDKIYSRSVNKSGLAARVIDQKHPERAFTGAELNDILATNTMVCCELCDRWRIIPPWAEVKDGEFDGFWCCDMNKYDKPRAKCEAKERDQAWYHMYFQKEIARRQKKELAKLQRQEQREKLALSQESQDILVSQSQEPTLYESEMRESMDVGRREDPNKGRNTSRDVILRRLIYTAGGSKASHEGSSKKGQKKHVSSWISKYHFHESLLKDDKQEAQNSKDAAAAVAADAAAKAIAGASAKEQPAGVTTPPAVVVPPAKPPSSKKKANDKKSKSNTSSKKPSEGSGQKKITNSPPPSPDASASSKKKADNRTIAVKSEAETASAKKRTRNDSADEPSNVKTDTTRTNKKPRPADQPKKKVSDVHVITRRENGHDVLEIIDSDEEEEVAEEAKREDDDKVVDNGDGAVRNDDDDDYEGVDGVLV